MPKETAPWRRVITPAETLRRMQAKCRGRDRTIRRLDSKLNHLYQRIAQVRIAAQETERRWRKVVSETNHLRTIVVDLEQEAIFESNRADNLWHQVSVACSVN